MCSSGPAAQPVFCGVRTKGAGLIPCSEEAITIRAVLEDPDRVRCWDQQIWFGADLGSEIFASLTSVFT